MTGPRCLCGHFDDCPACHEPNYDRHQVLKHLAEMSPGKRIALIDEIVSCTKNGALLCSDLKRISGVDRVAVPILKRCE